MSISVWTISLFSSRVSSKNKIYFSCFDDCWSMSFPCSILKGVVLSCQKAIKGEGVQNCLLDASCFLQCISFSLRSVIFFDFFFDMKIRAESSRVNTCTQRRVRVMIDAKCWTASLVLFVYAIKNARNVVFLLFVLILYGSGTTREKNHCILLERKGGVLPSLCRANAMTFVY